MLFKRRSGPVVFVGFDQLELSFTIVLAFGFLGVLTTAHSRNGWCNTGKVDTYCHCQLRQVQAETMQAGMQTKLSRRSNGFVFTDRLLLFKY